MIITRSNSNRLLRLHVAVILVGLMSITFTSLATSAPPVKAAPLTRPLVVAVLTDGTMIEGILEGFNKGVYTVRSANMLRVFSEKDIRSIAFQEQNLTPANGADKPLAELIKQFIRPHKGRHGYPERGGDPAMIPLLAAKGPVAIKPLIDEVNKRSELYQSVGKIFEQMGPDVIPKLIEALRRDASHGCRMPVSYALRSRGVASTAVLKELLVDRDPRMRGFALYVLYNIGIQSGTTLPESLSGMLIKLLDDPDTKVGAQVPSILGMVGKPADKIVPALIKTLKDNRYAHLDHNSTLGLGSIGKKLRQDDPLRKKIIAALIDSAVNHSDPSVRSSSALYLGYLGPATDGAVNALKIALTDSNEFVRKRARDAMYKLGKTPPAAVLPKGKNADAALITILTGEDYRAAGTARKRLQARKPDKKLLDMLMAAVRADDENRYWPSVSYIVAEWDQKKVLPMLETFLSDKHWRVRRTVALAFGKMNLTSLPKGLAKLQDDTKQWVRMETTKTLALLSKGAKPEMLKAIVPLLIKGLKDESIHREYWWQTARALGAIGSKHPDAVQALIDLMNNAKNYGFRDTAAGELCSIARRLNHDHKDLDLIIKA
ncbi:MAG TPA: hypothetical protein ENL03_03615, partial [Phycisphaerae bacterium]|nr:hypothetical protein [Phycisphaerae bacterium]